VSEPAATTSTDWEARARTAEQRVQELAAERARLWEELHQLRAQERAVDQAQAVVRYMEGTVSWKLTRPLRDVKTLWVRGRRTLTRD
jgi:hypothetical protein